MNAADGGTEQAPVLYRAQPGQKVRLIGGRRLSNWSPVTAQDVLPRLPEAARKQVLQCDLKAAGISNFGKLTSRGFDARHNPPTSNSSSTPNR
ncbi:MAG: hypothetical protein U0903_15780 [Planctomycetales bacterium]